MQPLPPVRCFPSPFASSPPLVASVAIHPIASCGCVSSTPLLVCLPCLPVLHSAAVPAEEEDAGEDWTRVDWIANQLQEKARSLKQQRRIVCHRSIVLRIEPRTSE